jgi:hypothetical protein
MFLRLANLLLLVAATSHGVSAALEDYPSFINFQDFPDETYYPGDVIQTGSGSVEVVTGASPEEDGMANVTGGTLTLYNTSIKVPGLNFGIEFAGPVVLTDEDGAVIHGDHYGADGVFVTISDNHDVVAVAIDNSHDIVGVTISDNHDVVAVAIDNSHRVIGVTISDNHHPAAPGFGPQVVGFGWW